jgi:hypothetical protein
MHAVFNEILYPVEKSPYAGQYNCSAANAAANHPLNSAFAAIEIKLEAEMPVMRKLITIEVTVNIFFTSSGVALNICAGPHLILLSVAAI